MFVRNYVNNQWTLQRNIQLSVVCTPTVTVFRLRYSKYLHHSKYDYCRLKVCPRMNWTNWHELTCNKSTQLHDAFIGHANQVTT